MKKLYLLIILFLATFIATQAQPGDTVRVLFIGNSFTAANNLPGLFEELARHAGHNVIVQAHTPGGVFLGDTRPGRPISHAYDPLVHQLLKREKWDYVVAQDNQGAYSNGLGSFSPLAGVYQGHQAIRDTLRAGNPCGKLILFAGWCFKNGWPGEFPDGASMNQRVYENYIFVNRTIKEIVSPIGIAWNRVMDLIPHAELWSPDEAHPALEGSYLAAATLYATIFRNDPEHVMFDGGVGPAEAMIMRKTAYEVVMDSMASTNLSSDTLRLTADSLGLRAGAGFTTYNWYLGGALVGTTQKPEFVPAASGCYRAIGLTANGCRQRSGVVCFTKTVVPAGIGNVAAGGMRIFPNPATDRLSLRLPVAAKQAAIALYDLKGRIVHRAQPAPGSLFEIALPQLPAGNYLLRVVTESGTFAERVQLGR